MKKLILFGTFLAIVAMVFAFAPNPKNNEASDNYEVNENEAATTGDALKWYSWEEAVKANETEKKIFLVDCYTYWCGWCKKMDKTTFQDPEVTKYLAKHFYPIKLDAEQKEDIQFQGETFKWMAGGRNGVHTLAYSLMEGKMSYPTIVYLNENFERIMISPGFKQAPQIMKELKYAAEGHYKDTKWDAFKMK